jgi:class 3 adenylate cyclase
MNADSVEEGPDRGGVRFSRLAAVWFADLVGYTRLCQQNEPEALRLWHVFKGVARTVVDRHGGRLVKFLGDGAMAEFASSDAAVRAASGLLRAFAATVEAEALHANGIRVGVHVGDIVVTDGGDLHGDGVNVASRIQAVGNPGEVWVSEDVWRQLRQRPEFRFQAQGERELKGIERPLPMYSVQVLDEATWRPPVDRPSVAAGSVGTPVDETVEALAERIARKLEWQDHRRRFLRSQEGMQMLARECEDLLRLIEETVARIASQHPRLGLQSERLIGWQGIYVRAAERRSLSVSWQPYFDGEGENRSGFYSVLWDGYVGQSVVTSGKAKEIREENFVVEWLPEEIRWKDMQGIGRSSTEELGEHLLKELLDEIDRSSA